MARALHTIGAVLGRAAITLAVFVTQIPSFSGRFTVLSVARWILPGTAPGRVTVGEVTWLSPWSAHLEHVSWWDLDGKPIVADARIDVRGVWRFVTYALGNPRLPDIDIHAREAWARAPRLTAPLSPAAQAAQNAAAPTVLWLPSAHARVDRVRLDPSWPLQASNVRIDGGLRLDGRGMRVALDGLHLDARVEDVPVRVDAHARVDTTSGTRIDGALSVSGTETHIDLTAASAPDGTASVALQRLVLPPGLLRRFVPNPDVAARIEGIRVDQVTARGPLEGPWTVHADLHVQQTPVTLDANGDLTQQHATVRFQQTPIESATLDGVAVLSHRDAGPAGQRFTVDTRGLRVRAAGYDVPGLDAEGSLSAGVLHIDRLDVPAPGISLHGEVDLRGEQPVVHARAHIEPATLAAYEPFTGPIRGTVRADVTADGSIDALDVTALAHVEAFHHPQATVQVLDLDARGRVTAGAPMLHATARWRGLRVAGAPLRLTGELTLDGDPTRDAAVRLAVTGHEDGVAAPSSLRASLRVQRDARGSVAVTMPHGAVSLRGAAGIVSARVHTVTASRGGLPVEGSVSLRTEHDGSVEVSIARGAAAVQAHAFDLRWLLPVVPEGTQLAGILDGELRVDPNHIEQIAGRLVLDAFPVPTLGPMRIALTWAPEGRLAHVHVDARRPRDTQELVVVDARVSPGVIQQPGRWFDDIEDAHAQVNALPLDSIEHLLPPPLQGRGVASLDVTLRRQPEGRGLAARVDLSGHGLTAGVDLSGGLGFTRRIAPATVPLTARVLACATLARASLEGTSLAVRAGISADSWPHETPPGDACDASQPVWARSLVGVEGTLDGPWARALPILSSLDPRRPAALGDDARATLRDTRVDLRVHAGPLRRADWPLHVVALPGAGAMRVIRPPDVPVDASVGASVHAVGSPLAPEVTVELDTALPAVPWIQLEEPAEGHAVVRVQPAPNGDLFGGLDANVEVFGQTSPARPRDDQARLEADVRVSFTLPELMDRGVDALTWRRADVSTENLQIERITSARSVGMRGIVGVNVRATGDRAQPVVAHVSLDGLSVRLPTTDGGERRSPAVNAAVDAVIAVADAQTAVEGCLVATIRPGPVRCEARGDAAAATGETLHARTHVPLHGEGLTLRPVADEAVVDFTASRFELAMFQPLFSDETLRDLGGSLEGSMHWEGAHPRSPTGHLALADGRATIPTVGELLQDVALTLDAQNGRVDIGRMHARLGLGTLDASGAVTFPEGRTASIDVHGDLRRFPAAANGNTWAWLDGSLRAEVNMYADRNELDLTLQNINGVLQEAQTTELQPLDQHPDVFVLGETRANNSGRASAPWHIRVHTDAPLWAHRSDLVVAVRTDLTVDMDNLGNAIQGEVALASNQCWVSVLGRRFEIDRARVNFDGSREFNPELDVAAHVDSTASGRLTLDLNGRFKNPSLVLAAEALPDASQSEILTLMLLDRRELTSDTASGGSNDAALLATRAALSFVSGFVSRSVRSEFSLLPTLILEPGADRLERVGAGLVVTPRLYVQGLWSAAASTLTQTAAGAQGVGGEFRFLAEYALSQAWSVSAFWVTNGSSNAWGGDVYWTP